jgi:hypothetical protein
MKYSKGLNALGEGKMAGLTTICLYTIFSNVYKQKN